MPNRIYGSFEELAAHLTGVEDLEDWEAIGDALMEKWGVSSDGFEDIAFALLKLTIPQEAPLSSGPRHVFAVQEGNGSYRALVQTDHDPGNQTGK